MRYIKISIVMLIGVIGASFISLHAYAQEAQSYGGNSASDYQPPTGNPQNSTLTGLQTNNTPLQPVPGINQQSLLRTQDLKVSAAGDRGAESTVQQSSPKEKSQSVLPTYIIGGLLTLAAVLYVLFKPDKPRDSSFETNTFLKDVSVPSTASDAFTLPKPKPKAKLKGSKKTTRKKRKSTK